MPEFKIVEGDTRGMEDVQSFIDQINRLDTHPMREAHGLFDEEGEICVGRAPGRLDVMGGIADYSGSLVLQLPTREATVVGLQRTKDTSIRVVSGDADENARLPDYELQVSDLTRDGSPISLDAARALFARDPRSVWASYVLGTFLILMHEKGLNLNEGARLLVSSDVPEGKGVSSSAALEVATMMAVCGTYDISLEPREMALLCQKVENQVVGAPCGVMDQMTAVCGQEDELMALLCQPAELRGTIGLPEDIDVWGIDSGIRHHVSGSDYTSVRVGAFMGYRILAELAGLTATPGDPIHVDDPRWKGYLANLSPSEFEQNYAQDIPPWDEGDQFIKNYGGTTDPVTQVDPETTYNVRMPTRHPIYENYRVKTFSELLSTAAGRWQIELLGELMFQSHASYTTCGLDSAGTDRLVELVREVGPGQGLYGAKITGGGSGGTVAVIGHKGSDGAIEEVAGRYERETGHKPHIFTGSSLGAVAFGTIRLESDHS
ncbi:MAG TPA: GHMP kinase [Candidatus Latescibacteria bacterium]|nr:GHMP kinase [Candidatus Latescibacterota bacterium]